MLARCAYCRNVSANASHAQASQPAHVHLEPPVPTRVPIGVPRRLALSQLVRGRPVQEETKNANFLVTPMTFHLNCTYTLKMSTLSFCLFPSYK